MSSNLACIHKWNKRLKVNVSGLLIIILRLALRLLLGGTGTSSTNSTTGKKPTYSTLVFERVVHTKARLAPTCLHEASTQKNVKCPSPCLDRGKWVWGRGRRGGQRRQTVKPLVVGCGLAASLSVCLSVCPYIQALVCVEITFSIVKFI